MILVHYGRNINNYFNFLQACTATSSNQRMGGDDLQSEDITPQAIKERMTPAEWNTIYKMSQDKSLYQNLITSLFPTIHGNEEVCYNISFSLIVNVVK